MHLWKSHICLFFYTLLFFMSRHNNWELFKSYIWTIFSCWAQLLNILIFHVTIVQCQNAQNKYCFFIAHLFNIFSECNKCTVFCKNSVTLFWPGSYFNKFLSLSKSWKVLKLRETICLVYYMPNKSILLLALNDFLWLFYVKEGPIKYINVLQRLWMISF